MKQDAMIVNNVEALSNTLKIADDVSISDSRAVKVSSIFVDKLKESYQAALPNVKEEVPQEIKTQIEEAPVAPVDITPEVVEAPKEEPASNEVPLTPPQIEQEVPKVEVASVQPVPAPLPSAVPEPVVEAPKPVPPVPPVEPVKPAAPIPPHVNDKDPLMDEFTATIQEMLAKIKDEKIRLTKKEEELNAQAAHHAKIEAVNKLLKETIDQVNKMLGE